MLTNTPVSLRMGTLNELAAKCNAPVIAADATSVADLEHLVDEAMKHFGGPFDFALHSIGMSPNVRKAAPTTTWTTITCKRRSTYRPFRSTR